MENQKEPVMGYPPRFFQQPPAATATTNIANPSPAARPIDKEKQKRFDRNCSYFCGGLFLIAFALFTWYCFTSKDPEPNFQLSSLSVSPFNLSSSSSSSLLTANWNVDFFVQNPHSSNRFFYERLDVSVLYRGVSLSSSSVAPFYQNERDERSVNAGSALSVGDGFVNNEIIGDWQHGAVNFTVRLDGTVRVIWGCREGPKQLLRVSCSDVTVGFSGNTTVGAMVGGSRDCKVLIKMEYW